MYTAVYNNRDCRELGLKIVKRPDIPAPSKRVTEITIPGRSGRLHIDEGTYDPIEISVHFNFCQMSGDWAAVLREIRKWLLSEKDKRLFFSDDPFYYYKVNFVRLEEKAERKMKKLGYMEVVFSCDPYVYARQGDVEISIPCKLYNDGEIALPLYKITGEGVCTLTVNTAAVTANVGQELMIDVEKMMAYREKEVQNTAVSGDIGELKLVAGENVIMITEGFSCTVMPRWRYV